MPLERDLADGVAGDAQAGDHGVVVESVLGDDPGVVGGREQPVLAVGDPVDDEELTGQTGAVDVRPAGRDALVAAVETALGARCVRVGALGVHEAERLLESRHDFLVAGVEQRVPVEVAQVEVAVGVREHEEIGVVLGPPDVAVDVPSIVGEEVEAQQLVGPRLDAVVEHRIVTGREALGADREVSNNGHQVRSHGAPPSGRMAQPCPMP
jgi:hypothetical protein